MFFLANMLNNKLHMPKPEAALKGRAEPLKTAETHVVSGRPLKGDVPAGMETAFFAMGRFWGAEKLFWQVPGVWVTATGFQGGYTENPTWQELQTGLTGHAETVRIVFDPAIVSYDALLKLFWENHDPTQGNKQGSDIGTPYRSVVFAATTSQRAVALASRDIYAAALKAVRPSLAITTEIRDAPPFYFAEEEHQQYLARNPSAGHAPKGAGVPFPA